MSLAAAPSRSPEPQVDRLHAAFRVFTTATASLEREYRTLRLHVDELRAELARKNVELRQSLERQRELEAQAVRQSRLAAMGEMAATLAHEIRNPLGAMELFARVLIEEVAADGRARRLAEQVSRGVADLNQLVSGILDFSRPPEPRPVEVSVDAVLDEALRLAAPFLGEGIRVRRAPSGVRWRLDRGLIVQTLLNLIRNASEAMGEGEISLEVTAAGELRIAVVDEGPGIPAGSEEAIFAPFYTTKVRGTGLGLAASRAAVQAHGGTLVAERRDRGAAFVLRLPRDRTQRRG